MGFATISGKEKAIRSGAEMSNKYRARELKPERIYLWVQHPSLLHHQSSSQSAWSSAHTGNGQEKVLRQENMVESLVYKEDQKATKLEYDKAN